MEWKDENDGIIEVENNYFQTWYYVVHLPVILQRIIKWCCGKRGHEWSETEKGYDGGNKIDIWCRWCNFKTQVPLSEEPSANFLVDLFYNDEVEKGK